MFPGEPGHSAICYVTPKDKLEGRDNEIFEKRDQKLAEAREIRKQNRQSQHQKVIPINHDKPNIKLTPAIDFAVIHVLVTMAAVLKLLGFRPLSSRGNQQRGSCPLHGSKSGTSRCFSANLEKKHISLFQMRLWGQCSGIVGKGPSIDTL
jgi:hypothetical protein